MQGNNGTTTGGNGGSRPTLDQIIWMGLGSNPGKMTAWTGLGAAISGLATGKILLDTGRYYDFFHRRDSKWVQIGVAIGTMAACAQFGICIAQAWKLAKHAFTDFHNVNRFDAIAGNTSDLIGTFLNFAASSYYTHRAYKMSGRKWWLGGFIMVFTCATFVMGSLVAIKGMTAPKITLETAMKMKTFNDVMLPLRRAWGALSMTSDGMVVVVMMFYLFRSRTSVFHREMRIYHKLIILILETMLPPAICILILDITAASKTAPSADYRKPIRMLVPSLFYVSLLHSLVARATIRQMLGNSLPSNGLPQQGMTTTAGESIFVATYPETESKIGDSGDTKERDLESGGEEVVPVEGYRRAGSPISRSSTNPNKSKTAL